VIYCRTLKIGTRGSRLALLQTQWVAERLLRARPGIEIEIVTIKTKGDRILDSPLSMVGGKGIFVKEIEDALLSGTIDLAVHSMKDLPSELPRGLKIGAVPEREDPRDALITKDGRRLSQLGEGEVIATSSLRRKSQIRHMRPDLAVVDLRGNVDTRLRKLLAGDSGIEAIVLALAGIKRMGLMEKVTEILDPDRMIPAAGQGALAIEVREGDPEVEAIVRSIEDPATRACIRAERAFLEELQAGCQVPAGAIASFSGEGLEMSAMVADPEGKELFRITRAGPSSEPEALGRQVARSLLDKGAREILRALRTN